MKHDEIERIDAFPLALDKLEDERKDPPMILKRVNLVGEEVEKSTFIAKGLEEGFETALISLLKENQDVFAWLYKDMPGLDAKLITHRLAIDPVFNQSNRQ